jgi:hypothetical protein
MGNDYSFLFNTETPSGYGVERKGPSRPGGPKEAPALPAFDPTDIKGTKYRLEDARDTDGVPPEKVAEINNLLAIIDASEDPGQFSLPDNGILGALGAAGDVLGIVPAVVGSGVKEISDVFKDGERARLGEFGNQLTGPDRVGPGLALNAIIPDMAGPLDEIIKYGGGLIGEVALDPLTYLSAGGAKLGDLASLGSRLSDDAARKLAGEAAERLSLAGDERLTVALTQVDNAPSSTARLLAEEEFTNIARSVDPSERFSAAFQESRELRAPARGNEIAELIVQRGSGVVDPETLARDALAARQGGVRALANPETYGLQRGFVYRLPRTEGFVFGEGAPSLSKAARKAYDGGHMKFLDPIMFNIGGTKSSLNPAARAGDLAYLEAVQTRVLAEQIQARMTFVANKLESSRANAWAGEEDISGITLKEIQNDPAAVDQIASAAEEIIGNEAIRQGINPSEVFAGGRASVLAEDLGGTKFHSSGVELNIRPFVKQYLDNVQALLQTNPDAFWTRSDLGQLADKVSWYYGPKALLAPESAARLVVEAQLKKTWDQWFPTAGIELRDRDWATAFVNGPLKTVRQEGTERIARIREAQTTLREVIETDPVRIRNAQEHRAFRQEWEERVAGKPSGRGTLRGGTDDYFLGNVPPGTMLSKADRGTGRTTGRVNHRSAAIDQQSLEGVSGFARKLAADDPALFAAIRKEAGFSGTSNQLLADVVNEFPRSQQRRLSQHGLITMDLTGGRVAALQPVDMDGLAAASASAARGADEVVAFIDDVIGPSLSDVGAEPFPTSMSLAERIAIFKEFDLDVVGLKGPALKETKPRKFGPNQTYVRANTRLAQRTATAGPRGKTARLIRNERKVLQEALNVSDMETAGASMRKFLTLIGGGNQDVVNHVVAALAETRAIFESMSKRYQNTSEAAASVLGQSGTSGRFNAMLWEKSSEAGLDYAAGITAIREVIEKEGRAADVELEVAGVLNLSQSLAGDAYSEATNAHFATLQAMISDQKVLQIAGSDAVSELQMAFDGFATSTRIPGTTNHHVVDIEQAWDGFIEHVDNLARGAAPQLNAGWLTEASHNFSRLYGVGGGVYAGDDAHIIKTASTMFRTKEEEVGFLKFLSSANRFWRSQAVASPGFEVGNYMGGMYSNFREGVTLNSNRIWHKYNEKSRAAALDEVAEGLPPRSSKLWAGIPNKYRSAFQTVEYSGVSMTTLMQSVVEDTAGILPHEIQKNPFKAASAHWRNAMDKEQGKFYSLLDSASIGLGQASTGFSHSLANGIDAIWSGGRRTPRELSEASDPRLLMRTVESHLRGTLMLHRLLGGASDVEALTNVYRVHLNYADLTKVEHRLRQLYPFYTWRSRALGYQLTEAISRPQRTFAAQRAYEETQRDNNSAWLPLWARGGSMLISNNVGFETRDPASELLYPLARIRRQEGFQSIAGEMLLTPVSPVLRAPIEAVVGTTAAGYDLKSTKIVPGPKRVSEALGGVLSVFGAASRDANGEWVTDAALSHVMLESLPLLSRANRLSPGAAGTRDQNNETDEQKTTAAWLGYMGIRMTWFNDKTRASAMRSLDYDAREILKEMEKQGFIQAAE